MWSSPNKAHIRGWACPNHTHGCSTRSCYWWRQWSCCSSPTKPLISEVSTTGAAKLRYHRQQLEHPFLVSHQEDIIIFSTESNLRHVACVDTLYMDGTFEVCPSTFYQICTIHTCATWQEQRNLQPKLNLHTVKGSIAEYWPGFQSSTYHARLWTGTDPVNSHQLPCNST